MAFNHREFSLARSRASKRKARLGASGNGLSPKQLRAQGPNIQTGRECHEQATRGV